MEQEEEHKNPLTRITTKSHKTFCTEFYYHPEQIYIYRHSMQRKEWEKWKKKEKEAKKWERIWTCPFFNIQWTNQEREMWGRGSIVYFGNGRVRTQKAIADRDDKQS